MTTKETDEVIDALTDLLSDKCLDVFQTSVEARQNLAQVNKVLAIEKDKDKFYLFGTIMGIQTASTHANICAVAWRQVMLFCNALPVCKETKVDILYKRKVGTSFKQNLLVK